MDSRLNDIAQHTIKEMEYYWHQMVPVEIEQSVRLVMSARAAVNKEMKDIERLLEKETAQGTYARLSHRYLHLFKEQVRLAVAEVRFGVKR